MKTVVVDKIASITQALILGHELRVATTDIPCDEGVVLVVEILTNKSTYNTLELTSGRMAKVAKGDVIVGALGHRQALFGYSGHLPEKVNAGDIIQVLNIGGVLGIVDSANPDKGRPFDARVIAGPFLAVVVTTPRSVKIMLRLAPASSIARMSRRRKTPVTLNACTFRPRWRMRDTMAHAAAVLPASMQVPASATTGTLRVLTVAF